MFHTQTKQAWMFLYGEIQIHMRHQ